MHASASIIPIRFKTSSRVQKISMKITHKIEGEIQTYMQMKAQNLTNSEMSTNIVYKPSNIYHYTT